MNWINVLAESLLISSVAQISIGLSWIIVILALWKYKNARVLYNIQKLVMMTYIVPVGFIYVLYRFFNVKDGSNVFPDVNAHISRIHSDAVKWYFVFLLPVIVSEVYQIIKLVFRCRRRLPEDKRIVDRLEAVKARLGIHRRIRIYQGTLIDSPFIVGLIRPCIYLPVEELNNEELDIVLQHELYHYKQGDTLWKPLILAACTLYYFNPFSWIMFVMFRAFSEISCDYRCCCNEITNKKYFSAILDVAEKVSGRTSFFMPNWFDGKSELKWRISFMKKYCRVKTGRLAVTMVALFTLVAGGITVSAAEKKIEDAYNTWYEDTVEEICLCDTTTEGNNGGLVLLMETEDEEQGLVIVEEEEPLISAYSNLREINWTVNPGVRMLSAYVSCSAGGYVNVFVDIKPSNKTVKVGIKYPNGDMYYVVGSGRVSYTFDTPTSGQYRYYITNTSDTTITATGSATYK